jgi:hypothetical protein
MFSVKRISIINTYLNGTMESTWKSYKSGWNTFIKFLMEEKYNNTHWEVKKECDKVYLEFLNWAFVGKQIPTSSINIAFSAVSKFFYAFIPDSSKILKEVYDR